MLQPADLAWPSPLADLLDPPAALHIAGQLPPWPRPVAIVGTRRADDEAIDFTHDLAAELARAGCTVVSGGALGIDAAAHEGALSVGGLTVAVLASGLRHAYPPEHAALFGRIACAGALVSEVDDCTPHRGRFLSRNRLIAAVAQAVVVVQAPRRSGALSTAACAKRLDRPVLAVPAAPWDVRGTGNLALLNAGAGICTRPKDVLLIPAFGGGAPDRGAPGESPASKPDKVISMPDLAPDAKAVWKEIGTRGRHVDQLARASALPIVRVQRALLELLLLGLVEEVAPGRYRRPPPDRASPGPN